MKSGLGLIQDMFPGYYPSVLLPPNIDEAVSRILNW